MLQVVVIGAGQAGLTAAYWLRRRGLEPWRDFVVLDANEGPGGAWRHRWPALTFDYAHGIHDLPGLPLGAPDPNEPSSAVVTRYYDAYEREFELPIIRPVLVDSVESLGDEPDAPLRISAGNRSWDSRLVINATGTWTRPFVPATRGASTFAGRQLRTVDFWDAEEFRGQHVVVVGGGLSAVQFILLLEEAGAETTWSTRRDPDWVERPFDEKWGIAVERRVDERASAGLVPHSVVRNTGIPQWPPYVAARERGRLVSDGRIDHIEPDAVVFESGKRVQADAILWATGFRPALDHLAPLRLREPGGGVRTHDVVEVVKDPRILLVGYASSASTIGATRAGRKAALRAVKRLGSMAESPRTPDRQDRPSAPSAQTHRR
ncbi:NAD(P)/FAD-dependent oxidoreductase [Gulosibacter macacae]|uniref:NAD(P)/FAD-dependent oxidoreductase n=1 Tax=Gulosibacter macacae TaxID=2488791 RepID=A0A3P3W0D4_9MICO|nr:NAD(P)/FAD-dependent oxidoreductase [Gulosibacter macacae]RRJ88234.1 NAD(P)/FAD-dependent oxidoreductase [Gulosibacter macacae]